jgi:hypothetical protein
MDLLEMHMKLSMKSVVLAATVAAMSSLASAGVITQWNFNQAASTPVATALVPSTGAGTITAVGGVTLATSLSSGAANGGSSDPVTTSPPNYGLQTTTYATTAPNRSAGIVYAVSTVGFQDISISYDLRHSNTSSRYEGVQYSLDGVNFVDIAIFDGNAGDTWFNGRSVDLSSIAGVANNPNFAFKVASSFADGGSAYVASNPGSAFASGGTWRFDMVTVSGNVIPEPSALGLLAPAGLLLARRRK